MPFDGGNGFGQRNPPTAGIAIGWSAANDRWRFGRECTGDSLALIQSDTRFLRPRMYAFARNTDFLFATAIGHMPAGSAGQDDCRDPAAAAPWVTYRAAYGRSRSNSVLTTW